MILLLDLGNTRSKFALYQAEKLRIEGTLQELSANSIRSIPHFDEVEKIMVSTVISLPKEIIDIIETKRIHSQANLRSKIYHLESLGEDRKFLALGAGANSLVICLGTCITYNVVNAENEFIAGVISPGLRLRANAMAEGTAQLPTVSLEKEFPTWGINTNTNLLAGVMAGVEFEILGFASAIKQQLPNVRILLTGGDAHFYSHLFPVDEHVLWKGMLQVMK
jgi:type III pantothenate kinase